MSTQTAKSRSDERRQTILDVAGELFMQDGYAAVSMSQIAARLGGSKGTLYNYFTSKTELFAAYMAEACLANSEALFATADDDTPAAEALRRFGRSFLSFVLSDDALAINRLVVAEAHRFPEVGQAFYEAGPKLSTQKLAGWLKHRMDRGDLRKADPEAAARQFFALCKSHLFPMRLWNVIAEVTAEDIARHVDAQVDMFLATYGAGAG